MKDSLLAIRELFTTDQGDLNLWGKLASAVLLLIFIRTLISILDRVVAKTIAIHMDHGHDQGRRITLTKVASSAIRYTVFVVGGLLFLQLLEVNTSTLIATAGVGTLAIAMGAQVLVKDVINGFFIILEGQYDVGDEVELAGKTGIVEEVGMRVTKVRDFDGSLHLVPNSEIRVVTNKNRGLMRAKVAIPVDEDQPVGRVLEVFEGALKDFGESWKPAKGPVLWGVTSTQGQGYIITAVAYDSSSRYYNLEYHMRQKLLEAMAREGIRQPEMKVKQK
ncbi:MAG: mechanosensitive ion channel [Tissierellia bacterium]|nr:mechanosensitive ion channel [Tissierellia bacterium]